jgi:hypothetical protein
VRQVIVQGALALATLGLLSGCTGSDDAPAPSASASAAERPPTGEVQQAPVLKEGWEGILRDVKVVSCPTEAGKVTAEGTVVNSADETRDISILVSWNAPNSTEPLMQLVVTKKGVPDKESVSWKASGDLPADAGQCVILARSGTLARS